MKTTQTESALLETKNEVRRLRIINADLLAACKEIIQDWQELGIVTPEAIANVQGTIAKAQGMITDICIVDFCGYAIPGHCPTCFWADWNGQAVIFGGDWSDVPDMPSTVEPSEETVSQWARQHCNWP